MRSLALSGAALPLLALLAAARTAPPPAPVSLTTLAYRVHRMPAMVAFYTEAFGARFEKVDARGIRSHFGRVGGLTLKFVPIRAEADFEEYPVHQPGFEVPDIAAVIRAAERHGGRVESPPDRVEGRLHAAVRDPDGNTVELYQVR